MKVQDIITGKKFEIEKSVVKEHTRRTKSGKISTVKQYIDKRKKQGHEFQRSDTDKKQIKELQNKYADLMAKESDLIKKKELSEKYNKELKQLKQKQESDYLNMFNKKLEEVRKRRK